MPIQMHHGQAVLAFVPDPGFSALRFVAVHIGQAMMQQHLMNGIMRDMLSMRELDDPFQPSCAQILLFVDFKYQLRGLFIQGLFLSSKFLNV
jgi:hypothetical protein